MSQEPGIKIEAKPFFAESIQFLQHHWDRLQATYVKASPLLLGGSLVAGGVYGCLILINAHLKNSLKYFEAAGKLHKLIKECQYIKIQLKTENLSEKGKEFGTIIKQAKKVLQQRDIENGMNFFDKFRVLIDKPDLRKIEELIEELEDKRQELEKKGNEMALSEIREAESKEMESQLKVNKQNRGENKEEPRKENKFEQEPQITTNYFDVLLKEGGVKIVIKSEICRVPKDLELQVIDDLLEEVCEKRDSKVYHGFIDRLDALGFSHAELILKYGNLTSKEITVAKALLQKIHNGLEILTLDLSTSQQGENKLAFSHLQSLFENVWELETLTHLDLNLSHRNPFHYSDLSELLRLSYVRLPMLEAINLVISKQDYSDKDYKHLENFKKRKILNHNKRNIPFSKPKFVKCIPNIPASGLAQFDHLET